MTNQKPHDIKEQIQLLRDRGLSFSKEELFEAHERFSRISYFRLKYYWRDLLDVDGDFIPGSFMISCSIIPPPSSACILAWEINPIAGVMSCTEIG